MGWSGYLVDKKNKIQFECYRTSEEEFIELVNTISEALSKNYEVCEEEDLYDIQHKKTNELTVKDLYIINQCIDFAINMNYSLDVLLAVLYYIFIAKPSDKIYSLDDRFDFYTDSNEEKVKQYKDFITISSWEE